MDPMSCHGMTRSGAALSYVITGLDPVINTVMLQLARSADRERKGCHDQVGDDAPRWGFCSAGLVVLLEPQIGPVGGQ